MLSKITSIVSKLQLLKRFFFAIDLDVLLASRATSWRLTQCNTTAAQHSLPPRGGSVASSLRSLHRARIGIFAWRRAYEAP
jgi:hypothetical protein